MKIELFIGFRIFDREGRVIRQTTEKANSLVKGFPYLLFINMLQSTGSPVDTTGVARTVGTASQNLGCVGAAGDDTVGIQVGTGTNAVTINDYSLQAKILNGTSSGQLSYGGTTFVSPSVIGTSASFKIRRVITNYSGGDITINEVGIAALISNSGTYRAIIDRTIITPKMIANTNGTTVEYTFTVTV